MAFDRRDAPAQTRADIRLGEVALFLDLDGTLAVLETTPDAVSPERARTTLLVEARDRLGGRLAVISGRTIGEIDRILEAATPCASGVHGLERRLADGSLSRTQVHAGLAKADSVLRTFAETRPGILLEPKGLSTAIHYRTAMHERDAVRDLAKRLAEATGLLVQEGDRVVELRSPGPDKGDAIRAFMAEPPFNGARPIFIGDDLTDEPGFAAAQALGGEGVLVGAPRQTQARGTLAGVADVLAWIDRSLRSGVFSVEYGSWVG